MRIGQAVVALQISLCLMLLVGAGVLVRTLKNLENADLGMRTGGLLVFGVAPPSSVHTDADAIHFYQTVIGRLRTLPAVKSATGLGNRLGSGGSTKTRHPPDSAVLNA